MRLTSSFAVFRAVPDEQALTKARWFAREGRAQEAIEEYRAALRREPDLASGWMELFEVLRRSGRLEPALVAAQEAGRHFGPDAAMPLALEGAALAELGRTREAVQALEGALERDGNLALAWHELAYAAHRVGEYARALLALDRAFALEPHTDTLMLRGRILRDAGQYEAALVAFEGAHQSSEHDVPKDDAEREMAATKRAATLGGKRPRDFTARERVFVDAGTAVLEIGEGDPAALLARALVAIPSVIRHLGWQATAVGAVREEDGRIAARVAGAIGAAVVPLAALDPADEPLLVTLLNDDAPEWGKQLQRLARWRAGAALALVQIPGAVAAADLAGIVRTMARSDAGHAAELALSRPDTQPPVGLAEAASLAGSTEAPWRRRLLP